MVSHGAGDAEAGFRHVETADFIAWFPNAPTGRKTPGVGQITLIASQEIAVDRKNGGGVAEVSAELGPGTESGGRSLHVVTRGKGLIDCPSRLRELPENVGT